MCSVYTCEAGAGSGVSNILLLSVVEDEQARLLCIVTERLKYVPQKTLKLSTHRVGCEFSVIENVAVGQIFLGLLYCTPPQGCIDAKDARNITQLRYRSEYLQRPKRLAMLSN